MTQQEKDILFARAETLRLSFADPQLQAMMQVVVDMISAMQIKDEKPMGFDGKGTK